jgi:hypothetical protein
MELETRLRGIKLREAQPVHGSVTLTRAARGPRPRLAEQEPGSWRWVVGPGAKAAVNEA